MKNELQETTEKASAYALIIALLMNSVFHSQIYSWGVLAFACIRALMVGPTCLLVPCIMSDMIEGCFLITPSLTFSRAFCLLYLILAFLQSQGKFRIDKFDVFLVCFGLFHLASAFWSLSGEVSSALSLMLSIGAILAMKDSIWPHKDKLYRDVYFMAMCFTIWLFIMTFTSGGGFTGARIVFRDSLNANTICCACGICASILYGNMWIENGISFKWGKVYLGALVLMNCVTILFVGSRTSLIALVFTILLLPLWLGKITNSKNVGTRLFLLLLIAGCLLLVLNFVLESNDAIRERFMFQNRSMRTVDQRTLVWRALWEEVIPQHLVLGVGFGLRNVMLAVEPYVVDVRHAHNLFFAILSETGFVGLVLHAIVYFRAFATLLRQRNIYVPILLALMIFAFLHGIGEETINARWFWLILGLALAQTPPLSPRRKLV